MSQYRFEALNQGLLLKDTKLYKITGDVYRQDENSYVKELLTHLNFNQSHQMRAESIASDLVKVLRKDRLEEGGLEAFLFQYDLTSDEGIALMCMAEALLRIPDNHTIDKLIRDKLTLGNWESHLGKSHSMFVNAATWALMLTGKVLGEHQSLADRHLEQSASLESGLMRLTRKGGEPLVRQVVGHAMRILSKQFVMGRSIEEAVERARVQEAKGYRYSYDMLGEAAYTQEDAEKYLSSYVHAIETLAESERHRDPVSGPGISVKLSALHPRFSMKKRERVLKELVSKVKSLASLAQDANINFTIDAEESDSLAVLLEVFESLATDKSLQSWQGLGLAVQAYQKRALTVLDWVGELAHQEKRRLMIRLVKGAYWDTEIKVSQVNGLSGYPVFTRKPTTDVNYLACANTLLDASDWIYPQFATHNAHTVASIMVLAEDKKVNVYEFQCLHGMGAPLYDQIVKKDKHPCRIYAPVGSHQDLLAYLVRRLLENGANTSFVNRIANQSLSLEDLITNPVEKIKAVATVAHPNIPLPRNLFKDRLNSKGIDLNNPHELHPLFVSMDKGDWGQYHSHPTAMEHHKAIEVHSVCSPFDQSFKIGTVSLATRETIELTLQKAEHSFKTIPNYKERARQLQAMAEHLEEHMPEFMALLVTEAGKSIEDAVSEVREAVDFCRYYATEALRLFKPTALPGPTGEYNELSLWGRGIIACISPWNFPLAIFIGQVTAAYASGNCVIAKPASQTPLIAERAISGLHQVGVAKSHVQLLPGSGALVGNALVEDLRVHGVVFTGSTETAAMINQKLASRKGPLVPFIAETGGQNAMIVDSTALSEQVVQDVILSSFRSAGQRCSSLRVLYLQEDIADKMITMLVGAMQELEVGNPMQLKTDIGPVIDKNAQDKLLAHKEWLDKNAVKLGEVPLQSNQQGFFFAPCAYEIKSMAELTQEHFGPILHIIRFSKKALDQVINEINQSGFGLTLGIHSRIDETIVDIVSKVKVGNIYVNRNMIGAVVGVQPFGGEGLSGTGPKAGGPHYLQRLATERTLSINTTAAGGNASLMALSGSD